MDPVASCFRANIKNRIADTGRLSEKDLIPAHQSQRKRVDERIERISIVESDFTTHSCNTKGVAIMGNSTDDTGKQRTIPASIFRMIQRTKAQAVHRGNRPRAHRENVTQNSAHASCSTLKRLNKRRVIV